jgi:hypothetical protein
MKAVKSMTATRRQSLPRFRDGYCTAAVRAFTAAGLVIDGKAPTLRAAALRCGANVAYVRAAITLLRSENTSLMAKVAKGKVSMLAAAREVKRLGALVTAYRQASAADRVAFAKAVGPTVLFDTSLVPAL